MRSWTGPHRVDGELGVRAGHRVGQRGSHPRTCAASGAISKAVGPVDHAHHRIRRTVWSTTWTASTCSTAANASTGAHRSLTDATFGATHTAPSMSPSRRDDGCLARMAARAMATAKEYQLRPRPNQLDRRAESKTKTGVRPAVCAANPVRAQKYHFCTAASSAALRPRLRPADHPRTVQPSPEFGDADDARPRRRLDLNGWSTRPRPSRGWPSAVTCAVTYRLRDWLFSWCYWEAPHRLRRDLAHRAGPRSRCCRWSCPTPDQRPGRRLAGRPTDARSGPTGPAETNTMPNCGSWYEWRYLDPTNTERLQALRSSSTGWARTPTARSVASTCRWR